MNNAASVTDRRLSAQCAAALVLALCVIGPPVHALLYVLVYATEQLIRAPSDFQIFDTENLVQEVYSHGALPAAIVAAVLAILMSCWGAATITAALLTGFIVGTLNITVLLLLSDVSREPRVGSTFSLLAMHAVTWAVAALIFRAIMVRFMGFGAGRGALA